MLLEGKVCLIVGEQIKIEFGHCFWVERPISKVCATSYQRVVVVEINIIRVSSTYLYK